MTTPTVTTAGDDICGLQAQLTTMAVGELNVQRAIVRQLRLELSRQLPLIWWQQETIEMLKQQLNSRGKA